MTGPYQYPPDRVPNRVVEPPHTLQADMMNQQSPPPLGDPTTVLGTRQADMVNQPPHYTQGDIECIDAIRSALTHEQFAGFLRGQVLKYTWRMGFKGAPIEDTEKAGWYLGRLTHHLQTPKVKT